MAITSSSQLFAAFTLAGLVLAGCSGNTRTLDLLDSKPKVSAVDEAEAERLRQLQLIKLTPYDAAGKALPDITVSPETISSELSWACPTPPHSEYSLLPYQGRCQLSLMEGQAPLCLSHQLLGAIQPNGGIKLTDRSMLLANVAPNAATFLMRAQSPAANVALARAAKIQARRAMSAFLGGLAYSTSGNPGTPEADINIGAACSTNELNYVLGDDPEKPALMQILGSQSILENLSNYFIESYKVLEEAVQKEVDGMVAYGDFQRANPSLTQGVDQGVLGLDLSRASAAHALVGGGTGLRLALTAGQDPPPFRPVCSRPNLSPGGRQALDLMRQAALRPSDVLSSTLSIDSLVNGSRSPCDSASCGSVKQRLNNYSKTTSPIDDVQLKFGLAMADFGEARDYLREEFVAFRRYPGQLETSPTDVFPRFGGIATTPLVPDGTFYRAVAAGTPIGTIPQGEIDLSTFNYSPNSPSLVYDYNLSLATYLDLALARVQKVLSAPAASAPATASGYQTLLAWAGEGYRRRLGRMALWVWRMSGCDPNSTLGCAYMQYNLPGIPTSKGYKVAFGDQAMECMTKGRLDGYACSLSSFTISTPNVEPLGGFGDLGFTNFATEWVPPGVPAKYPVSENASFGALFPGERIYLLRPRVPQTNDIALPPGDYEAIGSGVVPPIPATAGTAKFGMFPIIPEFDQKVRDLLAPSKAWCTQQAVTCSGGHFDERLPLENELTEDGSPSESSWRHYLDLAKTAAAEADAIGSEMVQHGIDLTSTVENQAETQRQQDEAQRVQVEQTLEELQNICGTSVDPRTLIKAFSSKSDENLLDQTPLQACPCNWNQRCYSGQCIPDPLGAAKELAASQYDTPGVQKSDVQRLVGCIGDDTVIDFITVGTVPVCVWIPNGSTPNSYCSIPSPAPTDNKQATCPAKAKITKGSNGVDTYDCSTMTLPRTTGFTTRQVTDALGFFDNSDQGQPDPGEVAAQCTSLAHLRANRQKGKAPPSSNPWQSAADGAKQVIASNRLHVDAIKLLAPSLGWLPTVGGFSSITFNGEPIYTTGKFGAHATTGWPCDPAMRTGPEGTLFGPPPADRFDPAVTCGNESYRAYINQRMRDAVMAAQATTTNKFANITWPTGIVPSSLPSAANAVRSTVGVAPPTTTLPLFRDQYPGTADKSGLTTYWTTGPWTFWVNGDGASWADAVNSFVPPGLTGSDYSVKGYPFKYDDSSKPPTATFNASTTPPSSKIYSAIDEHLLPEVLWYGAGQDGRVDTTLYAALPKGNNRVPANWTATFAHMLNGSAGPNFKGFLFEDDESSKAFRLNADSLWDAAELMCITGAPSGAPSATVTSGEDVSRAALYLEQTANYITDQAGRRVFAKFSKAAKDALRKEGGQGAFPALGGQMAEEVSRLRTSLIDLGGIAPKIASQLRLFAGDLRTFRGVLQRNGLERDINTLEFTSQAANNITECAKSVMDAMGAHTMLKWGGGGKAAATCANAAFQTVVASKIKNLKNQISAVNDQIELANFSTTFETRNQALLDLSNQALKLTEECDEHLAEAERLRMSARRALDRAILQDSFSNKVHYRSNDAMRRRLNTDKIRYEQHLEDAKRLSFVAKRAIEQRIGIHLSEMTFDMPLVDAPAGWEAQLCTLQGVDYANLVTDIPGGVADKANYASSYIGDYVSKLEKVVESYVLSHNFHEAHDTAVISLKDDIVQASQSCTVSSRNLLTYSNDLSHFTSDSLTTPGWEVVGCATKTVDGVTTLRDECITVTPDSSQMLKVEGNTVPGFLIRRGPRCPTVATTCGSAGLDSFVCGECGSTVPTCPSGGCGVNYYARLRQRVALKAGKYRISYYTKPKTTAAGGLFGIGGVSVVNGVGSGLTTSSKFLDTYAGNNPQAIVETLSGYSRVFADFTLSAPDTVSVLIGPDMYAVFNEFQTQTLTGIMLEDITNYGAAPGGRFSSPFASTGETLTSTRDNCPDADGSAFRKKAWVRNCLSLCNNGFGDTCSEAGQRRECFWELNFSIAQRFIESGQQLSSAGFAKGNFNYRIQNVAVNFVGTGLRDCSGQPDSCNGGGFVQYSLSHQGPFFVRNHFGGTFEAKLFDGNIEHARGLGIERYITNPISSADSSLLQPYMHGELSGRPLDGNFVLRIWESPELDLSKITDVQVIMDYGYWTRFN